MKKPVDCPGFNLEADLEAETEILGAISETESETSDLSSAAVPDNFMGAVDEPEIGSSFSESVGAFVVINKKSQQVLIAYPTVLLHTTLYFKLRTATATAPCGRSEAAAWMPPTVLLIPLRLTRLSLKNLEMGMW